MINEDRASELLGQIGDPVVRNLVNLAVARARKRFIRWAEQSEESWKTSLPARDFDIAFFVEVMVETFSRRELLEKLLGGATLDDASGWSVE